MRASLAFALLTATAALGGCLNEADPIVEETDGVLGLGTFRWGCTSNADTTCGTGDFPTAVALGGRFDLSFIGSTDLPEEVRLRDIQPASRDRISQIPEFNAVVEGRVSMSAMSSRGELIDFVTLTVLPVDQLSLSLAQEDDHEDVSCGFIYCQEIPPPGPMEGGDVAMYVGDSPRVQTMPYANGSRLAGTLDYQWESLTPDLLRVGNVQGREAQLWANGEGNAQLRITAGGHEEIIEVFIAGPPPPDPDMDEEPPRRNPPEDDDTGTGGDESGSGDESGTGGESTGGTQ